MSKSKSQAFSLKKVLQKTKSSWNSGAPSPAAPFILGMKDASWSHTWQAEVQTAPKNGGISRQTCWRWSSNSTRLNHFQHQIRLTWRREKGHGRELQIHLFQWAGKGSSWPNCSPEQGRSEAIRRLQAEVNKKLVKDLGRWAKQKRGWFTLTRLFSALTNSKIKQLGNLFPAEDNLYLLHR